MWQSSSVLVGQPLRKLSLGIERLQQKKFRNFANFIMFQQTIFLIRNLFNLNRLCLRTDLKNSMKKISRKFKFSVLYKTNLLGFNQIAKQRVIKLFNQIFTLSSQCTSWPFWLPYHLHDARCCFCSHAFPGLPGTSLVR